MWGVQTCPNRPGFGPGGARWRLCGVFRLAPTGPVLGPGAPAGGFVGCSDLPQPARFWAWRYPLARRDLRAWAGMWRNRTRWQPSGKRFRGGTAQAQCGAHSPRAAPRVFWRAGPGWRQAHPASLAGATPRLRPQDHGSPARSPPESGHLPAGRFLEAAVRTPAGSTCGAYGGRNASLISPLISSGSRPSPTCMTRRPASWRPFRAPGGSCLGSL